MHQQLVLAQPVIAAFWLQLVAIWRFLILMMNGQMAISMRYILLLKHMVWLLVRRLFILMMAHISCR
jgi:hypothetical protein